MDILQDKHRLSGPSFTFNNRVRRVAWGMTYLLFFRFTPRFFYSWRAFLLRMFGAKIGKHCHVYPKVDIWAPWNLEMADYSCLANNVICYSQDKITLGEKVIISQGAHLCTGTHDYTDPDFKLMSFPIVIEKDAWICTEAFVGPGVTISEGAVLGARAVTFKNLESWKVYAASSAIDIKDRVMRKSSHG